MGRWILRLWWLWSVALSLYSLRLFINSAKKTGKTTGEFIKHLGE